MVAINYLEKLINAIMDQYKIHYSWVQENVSHVWFDYGNVLQVYGGNMNELFDPINVRI